MKKAFGYFFVAIFIIASLIGLYYLITKGYPGSKNETSTGSPSGALEMATPVPSGGVTGNVTSSKISLVVTSPKNGATLDSTNVAVTGKTTPAADVFVNDVSGKADANGNFSISIGLDEGENTLVVSANDANGNVAEQSLTVVISSF